MLTIIRRTTGNDTTEGITTLRMRRIRNNEVARWKWSSLISAAPKNSKTRKKRALTVSGLFFSFLLCRVASSYYSHNPFTDDSHRVRGVFSFVALLSPVESSKMSSGALGAHAFLVRFGDVDCKAFLRNG